MLKRTAPFLGAILLSLLGMFWYKGIFPYAKPTPAPPMASKPADIAPKTTPKPADTTPRPVVKFDEKRWLEVSLKDMQVSKEGCIPRNQFVRDNTGFYLAKDTIVQMDTKAYIACDPELDYRIKKVAKNTFVVSSTGKDSEITREVTRIK